MSETFDLDRLKKALVQDYVKNVATYETRGIDNALISVKTYWSCGRILYNVNIDANAINEAEATAVYYRMRYACKAFGITRVDFDLITVEIPGIAYANSRHNKLVRTYKHEKTALEIVVETNLIIHGVSW